MMNVPQVYTPANNVYYQDTTTNQSFMKMHYFLKARGIKHNKFFLGIYDAGLMGVDPRDPTLSLQMKMRILKECMSNFWYFIREVVRIPEEGGVVGSGKRYELSRGNLAMNYMFIHNINQFVEFPRQHGKTVSALCWYLWVFNFGAKNTRIIFANKKHDDSKGNLRTLKNLRSTLPDYLKIETTIGPDGKYIKVPNTMETLQHPRNNNLITTLAGARTPALAEGAGRGATVAIQYYDEFAFLPYNDIVYAAAAPAFSKASENAAKNNSPYGMLITTTPGDLTTREGQFADRMRNNATEWDESLYDLTDKQLKSLIDSNTSSTFMHIRYTYQMLGNGPKYFDKMIRELNKDWSKIRREVLLEWSKSSENSPFNREDLDIIEAQVKEEPISILRFGKAGQFVMKFWDSISVSSSYPPIIGVDVSSGIRKDASAITVIDSQTTKVLATFKSNFITMPELADLLYNFITTYARNAICVVENNGGFGSSVLQMLLRTNIKKNLYYEIKDKIIEEQFDGVSNVKKTSKKCKVYGATSSFQRRNELIEILHQRVQHHRDKFATKELYDELCTMVVKSNGKVEHSDDAHDDLVFSYLWALYVFYHGKDLATRFHLMKTEIFTDDHYEETSYNLEEEYIDNDILTPSTFGDATEDSVQMVDAQLEVLNPKATMSFEEFRTKELIDDLKCLEILKQTKDGRIAISKAHLVPLDRLEKTYNGNHIDISNDICKLWYGDYDIESSEKSIYTGNLSDNFKKIK